MIAFSLPPLTVEIADDNIASQSTDAIVNALRLVRFVLFGGAAYREFVDIAGDLLGRPLDGPADCPLSSQREPFS